jgi:HSP20 family molecular chaperone IbpA
MSTELSKPSWNDNDNGGGALTYSPLRDMLGYDPFRRFFSNVGPQIDVIRTEKGFDVEIPVPGFKTDEIEVVVKDNILTVTGKSDRRAFTRSLKLPDDVDTQSIEASVENGLLQLNLSRHPDAQPRKIEIRTRASSN